MSRVRAADDFDAIRLRLEELRRERSRLYGGNPVDKVTPQGPDAAAHVPGHVLKRILSEARRSSSR